MFTLNCKGKLLTIEQPIVMGILNATPDSFFEANRHENIETLLQQAAKMIREGTTIIDVGGQSTRPGSELISAGEELTRVIPAIEAIHARFPDTIISVDTFYSSVAAAAVNAGASMVNDISAGAFDTELISTVASLKVPYVLMHMKGTPQTMQQEANYVDVTAEVLDFLVHKMFLLREAGIVDIIVDPGFGFSKTIAQNLELLNQLDVFKVCGCPVLIGLSRKSTVYKTLNISPDEALNGSTVLHTIALMQGASIIRTHDVKETVEAISLVTKMKSSKPAFTALN